MSETRHVWFSDAEINQQALANASSLPYLMVAFARSCQRTPEEVAAFAGELFAPGWSRFAGLGADALVRQMALSLVCCGGELQWLKGDSMIAEVGLLSVPNAAEAEFFGISRDETDRFCAVFAPIATSLGFTFAWRRDGEMLILAVSQQPTGV